VRRSWILVIFILLVVDGYVGFRWYEGRREHRFDKHILRAANRYQVDPALVKAVIWRESAFNPDSLGKAGEIGLMQIRELAAQEWAEAEKLAFFTHDSLRDPQTNMLAGTWYLSKLLRRYKSTDNPLPYALADYNAGRTHVLRWMKGDGKTNSAVFLTQMDFPGTQKYIRTITERQSVYSPHFALAKK